MNRKGALSVMKLQIAQWLPCGLLRNGRKGFFLFSFSKLSVRCFRSVDSFMAFSESSNRSRGQADRAESICSLAVPRAHWIHTNSLCSILESKSKSKSKHNERIPTSTPNAVANCVDCFKCSSRNGSNPACEDPFHNLNSTRITTAQVPENTPNVILHSPCYAGKKGRKGLFPASACIKLIGTFGKYKWELHFAGCLHQWQYHWPCPLMHLIKYLLTSK